MTIGQKGVALRNALKKFSIAQRFSSSWAHVPIGPPDAILGITEAFRKDTNENKINVGVGAYRDDCGAPFVLDSVRTAEERVIRKCLNKEYAPIAGSQEFCDAAVKLAFGNNSPIVENKRYAAVQTLSGTGALRIAAAFLERFTQGPKNIHIPKPTWGNHKPIFKDSHLALSEYSYYDPNTVSFDFKGCIKDICNIPKHSIILLHACAHNPTGFDPSKEQWDELSQIIKSQQLVPFFDMAYQGFASGDFDRDAYALRKFVDDGHNVVLAQSFAKNMGLYGERVGNLTFTTDSAETAERILSQLKILIRPMYSNPPVHGARIATEIFKDKALMTAWRMDVLNMSGRIIKMRKMLHEQLMGHGSQMNWSHIVDQIGMFCYTGLNAKQAERLTKEFHVYLTQDGRISMAGVTSKNVAYLAKAMHEVTRK